MPKDTRPFVFLPKHPHGVGYAVFAESLRRAQKHVKLASLSERSYRGLSFAGRESSSKHTLVAVSRRMLRG